MKGYFKTLSASAYCPELWKQASVQTLPEDRSKHPEDPKVSAFQDVYKFMCAWPSTVAGQDLATVTEDVSKVRLKLLPPFILCNH